MTNEEYTKEVLNFIYKTIDKRDKIAYYNENWVVYDRRYIKANTLTDIIPFLEFYPLHMNINICLSIKQELIIFTDRAGYSMDEFVEMLFPREMA